MEGERFSARRRRFQTRALAGRDIDPRPGRSYPLAVMAGECGIVVSDRRPLRIISADELKLGVDSRHPLADVPVNLGLHAVSARETLDEHGAICNDIAMLSMGQGRACNCGIRMRRPISGTPTAFLRDDMGDDATFYAPPRLVHHLDCTDANCAVIGLGLNLDELGANERLAARLVQDLNQAPFLQFADGSFDSVVCTASFEYLMDLRRVVAEVARVLAPGGRCIITFSDRWFASKTIRLWSELHAFERMGLVLETLGQDGRFQGLSTLTRRGLPQPADDIHASRHALSSHCMRCGPSATQASHNPFRRGSP